MGGGGGGRIALARLYCHRSMRSVTGGTVELSQYFTTFLLPAVLSETASEVDTF